MLNINLIKQLTIEFRRKIEFAQDQNLFVNDTIFSRFSNGCCGDTSELLAQYLLDNGIKSKYVFGIAHIDKFDNIYSHAWLVVNDNIIVDITVDQFKNNPIFSKKMDYKPYFIGEKNEFYNMFEVRDENYREFEGLDKLNNASKRLQNLYQKIIEINPSWR